MLFLPSHTLYVLQPLDLSVFSSLKHAYRKRLGTVALLNDSSLIRKQNFIECYKRAREDALTPTNYRQGWSALGLWPVWMSKPLMNRLLLENSNKPADLSSETLGKVLVLEWNQNRSVIELWTPEKSEDIREQARQIIKLETVNSVTAKVLFRKITKGINQKDFVIA